MKTQKISLDNIKGKLSRKEMKKVNGGILFGIFCITGVLDGIHDNFQFHFGSCR